MKLGPESYSKVLLVQGEYEYNEVRNHFVDSLTSSRRYVEEDSSKIYRLQHPWKRAQHELLLREMKTRNDDKGAHRRYLSTALIMKQSTK
jgi:hypothetical protein